MRLRTKIANTNNVLNKKVITLPMALKNFVIPFPIELNRTPKSISSFSGFFGVDVLIRWFFVSLLAYKQNEGFWVLFYLK